MPAEEVMKKLFIILLTILTLCVVSCKKSTDEITVYAYDSFCSSYGPGEKLVKEFENKTNIKVNLISCGGAVELYSKILFEGPKCTADAVIGIPDTIKVDSSLFHLLKPFDYGIFSFVFNDDCKTVDKPQSLNDLLKTEYKDNFILIDPRTSTVGLGLYLWTIEEFGFEGALNWWKLASENALTIASSWSMAYGMFTEGEAPIVISYTTSPVYHYLNDKKPVSVLKFNNRYIGTTEYLGVLNTSDNKDSATLFCEYILKEGALDIAVSNTMFPADSSIELPEEYSVAYIPDKIASLNLSDYSQNIDFYLNKLSEALSR